MNTWKNINEFRRSVMRRLTRGIGNSDVVPALSEGEQLQIKRVLIIRPNNRLGNLLLITPLVQEVIHHFPNAKIDLFTRGGLAPLIFKNYPNVVRVIQLPKKPFNHLLDYAAGWLSVKKYRYDLVINPVNNSSSGRLSTKFAVSRFKIFGDIDNDIRHDHPDHTHVAKYPVYNLRKYLKMAGHGSGTALVPTLNIKLSLEELSHGHESLFDLVHNHKRTICLFTFATGSKCYTKEWWEPFYERLKQEFPDDNIIEVLPVENVSQLSFAAPSFYSKDIRELGALISNTDVFIGADSGIMHLASAVQTPTVGLFSVTNPRTFSPYGNESIAVNTNETSMDEMINTIRRILNTDQLNSIYRNRIRRCLENDKVGC